jgi:hypothetical protein
MSNNNESWQTYVAFIFSKNIGIKEVLGKVASRRIEDVVSPKYAIGFYFFNSFPDNTECRFDESARFYLKGSTEMNKEKVAEEFGEWSKTYRSMITSHLLKDEKGGLHPFYKKRGDTILK